ncbi:MAG: glycosyl hydrolase [Terracidiphilus sp.]
MNTCVASGLKGRAALVALASLMACAVFGQANKQPTDALRAGFKQPRAAAKLRCYWWWLNGNTTTETITRDLKAMKEHGYAGAILVDAGSGQQRNDGVPMGPAIGSPQWIALYVHALQVAQKLGLEISLNVTSRMDVGIIGGPTVKPEDAMKLLAFSQRVVEGGGDRTVQLAPPPEANGFYRPIAILAYPLRHGAPLPGAPGSGRTAIEDLPFKTASKETGISMEPISQGLRNTPSVPGEEDAGVNEVVDLSSHMRADGTLQWTFPSGTWEVLRIGYTDSPMSLTDYTGATLGLEMDAMSPQAFDHYWKQAIEPLLDAAKPYIGTSLRYLVTDSWEAGGTNWTAGFREEFLRRRGYDPVPYLPIVAGRILTSHDTSNRFLFDLRRTVADLIAENYYDRFADHAKKRGLGTHPEAGGPHGAPIDALENFRSSSYPQTEFWVESNWHRVTDTERFFVKEASSAAHIYGKPLVAAEGFTSMNLAAWSESPGANLQPTFDHALTEGLNRLIWHEFTSSPAEYKLPGQEYFAGTHLNPNVTWWRQAAPLLLAFNRAQYLMQQGSSVSDLLYFYGDQVPGLVRNKMDDPAHVLPGFDYDVTNEDALLHRMQFSASDLHTPEGLHYRALALPDSHTLSYPTLMWVKRFVHQGGIVIGLKPAGPLGLLPPQKKAEYTQTVNEMWGSCESIGKSEVRYGQGRIYCTANARSALTQMGAEPDFSYTLNGDHASSEGGEVLDYVHRRTASADIYFVRNTQARVVEATVSFRGHGRAPELWMPDTGATVPALVYKETKDCRTEIPLTFSAAGSVFIVFEHNLASHLVSLQREGREIYPSVRQGVGVYASGDSALVASEPGTYAATYSNGRRRTFIVQTDVSTAQIFGPWTLSFPDGWGAPSSIPVTRFESWTQSQDAGVKYFSGTGTYKAVLHIPSQLLTPQRQLWLNLGQVREIASVAVNGIPVQTLWRAPFVARIDPQLHRGDNTLEIQVTNLWPNRIIGDLQPSATVRYTHTNVRAYKKDSPLLPSGLLEPVTVQIGSVEHLR